MTSASPADELLECQILPHATRRGRATAGADPRPDRDDDRGRRGAFHLSARLVTVLNNRLAGGPCTALGDGALVRIDDLNLLSQDVFVDCSPFDPEPRFFEAPVLIAEVLSESTEARDRNEKWRLYRKLGSLRHYLLVAQAERRIEHYAREGGVWRYQDLIGDAELRIDALEITLQLAEVYAGIVEDIA